MGESTGREGRPIAEAFAGVHCGTSRRGANDGRAKEMGGRAACGPSAMYALSLSSQADEICAEPVLCPSNGQLSYTRCPHTQAESFPKIWRVGMFRDGADDGKNFHR